MTAPLRRIALRVSAVGVLLLIVYVAGRLSEQTPQDVPRARSYDGGLKRLADAKTPLDRCHALIDACKEAFALKRYGEAERLARELLASAPTHCTRRNIGNAIHDANLVLGRLALVNGDVPSAEGHLLSAGLARSSPSQSTFGPDMSLANDLLAHDAQDVVLQYLARCRRFWSDGHEEVDKWAEDIRAGRAPDFGPNLDR